MLNRQYAADLKHHDAYDVIMMRNENWGECYTVLAWCQWDCRWGMRHTLQLAGVTLLWLVDLDICWSQGFGGNSQVLTFFKGHWQSPCTTLTAGNLPAVRAVQGGCERVQQIWDYPFSPRVCCELLLCPVSPQGSMCRVLCPRSRQFIAGRAGRSSYFKACHQYKPRKREAGVFFPHDGLQWIELWRNCLTVTKQAPCIKQQIYAIFASWAGGLVIFCV